MTARGLKQAATLLEVHHASWIEVLPSDRVREIAETLPEHYGLRALDSFQLLLRLSGAKSSREDGFSCVVIHA